MQLRRRLCDRSERSSEATPVVETAATARRVTVIGSAKTIYRYADFLVEQSRRLHGTIGSGRDSTRCPTAIGGVEVLPVEVLDFQVDESSVERVVGIVLETSKERHQCSAAVAGRERGPRLRLIIASVTTVTALHDAFSSRELQHTWDSTCASAVEVFVVGPATETACRRCDWLRNVVFCGRRVKDIYEHLDFQQQQINADQRQREHGNREYRTLLLGVATGGDRSYRTMPGLQNHIEEISVYESVPVPGAANAVLDAFSWMGFDAENSLTRKCGGDLIVTSSKAGKVVLEAVSMAGDNGWSKSGASANMPFSQALSYDLQPWRIRVITLGESTASSLMHCPTASPCQEQSFPCHGMATRLDSSIVAQVIVAKMPTIDAIASIVFDESLGASTQEREKACPSCSAGMHCKQMLSSQLPQPKGWFKTATQGAFLYAILHTVLATMLVVL